MKITVIGSGYVGLVSGACFAEFGYNVTCVDIDRTKVENLNKGIIPIYEPGLDALVIQGLQHKRLAFTTDLSASMADCNIVMIAVGTPTDETSGHADLSYVYKAAEQIANSIKNAYTVVVTKSTVPVGTSRKVAEIIKKTRPDLKQGVDFDVASNPEFLREGSAIGDFMRPDRIVVGTDSDRARDVMQQLYRPLYLIETPIVFTSIESSELIKYAANGFLAMKIAFINQVADLCEKVGADVQDIAKGIGLDGRIGKKFLNVGPGYGGSCFPKDTLALSKTAYDFKSPLTLIDSVIEFNNARKKTVAYKLINAFTKRGGAQNKKVCVLGLTFKPNTDDIREAPSLDIIQGLIDAGITPFVYDPIYNLENPSTQFQGVKWCRDAYEGMENADALLIITEWNQFRGLDRQRISELLNKPNGLKPLVVDFRNIYKPHEMTAFEYITLGRRHD
jgi:UDPglucose 6-dehydrogenase